MIEKGVSSLEAAGLRSWWPGITNVGTVAQWFSLVPVCLFVCLFFKGLFYFHECFACMEVYHVSPISTEARRLVGLGMAEGCELLCECWELNLSPL